MPLTAEEQAELDQLNSEAGQNPGLTPDEERELAELNSAAGGDAPDSPASSPVTAATTGLANGASFGTAGEISAFAKAAMDGITGTRGPLAGGSFSDLGDDYRQARDSFNADVISSAKSNPGVSAVAHTLGAAANPAVSGGLGKVGETIKSRVGTKASALSKALGDEKSRQVAMAIAKRLGKRALKAAGVGTVGHQIIEALK